MEKYKNRAGFDDGPLFCTVSKIAERTGMRRKDRRKRALHFPAAGNDYVMYFLLKKQGKG